MKRAPEPHARMSPAGWKRPPRRVLDVLIHIDNDDTIGLFCGMGPDYTKHFGKTAFYNAWQKIITNVQENDTEGYKWSLIQIDMSRKHPDGYQVHDIDGSGEGPVIPSDIHLSYFYVTPNIEIYNPVEENLLPARSEEEQRRNALPPGVQYLSQMWTEREKAFFRGMGFKMLCRVLRDAVRIGRLNDTDAVTLEASGDFEDRTDMTGLVRYYERLSFTVAVDNLEWLRNALDNLWVEMYSTVGAVRQKCEELGRHLDPTLVFVQLVQSNLPRQRWRDEDEPPKGLLSTVRRSGGKRKGKPTDWVPSHPPSRFVLETKQ